MDNDQHAHDRETALHMFDKLLKLHLRHQIVILLMQYISNFIYVNIDNERTQPNIFYIV